LIKLILVECQDPTSKRRYEVRDRVSAKPYRRALDAEDMGPLMTIEMGTFVPSSSCLAVLK
jgi:hypothetical protein